MRLLAKARNVFDAPYHYQVAMKYDACDKDEAGQLAQRRPDATPALVDL